MHVIRKRAFEEAARRFPNDKIAIMDTYRVLNGGTFKTPEELKQVFPSLDNFKYKDKWYVIDIGGNNLRIMAMILFTNQKFYVKNIVTHAEYDKLCRKYRKEI
jgi:mRNA interferase HigB